MELRHLRYFIRAAELLHFTRAAESLYISQPSLSVHMQQLEEELNTKLFARVGRNVQLTEAGQILLSRARRAVEELERASEDIEALTGLLRGTLRLATVPLFGSKLLPGWTDTFSLRHPHVKLSIRAARAEDIETSLVAGNIDLGFSLMPAEHSEINVQEITEDELVMVISEQSPLAKKKELTVDDLATVSMALPSHKISSARSVAAYFEKIGITPNVVIEQDDGHGLLEHVKLGTFVTFLPSLAIRDDSGLRLMKLPPPGSPISLGAMWTQLTPAASAFLEVVSKTKAVSKT
ncbi:MAG TPA: LysR substrate-binding domain-containing protein [Chroococcales cyanobacterium]